MKRIRRALASLVGVSLAAVLAGCGSGGDAEAGSNGDFDAESFLRGKTLRLVITQDVGGTSDVVGRFIGTHLKDYLPGAPTIEITNVPDVAGVNRVFSAEADRLMIGATSTAQGLYTSAAEEGAEHDPAKIRVVGAIEPSPRGIILSSDTGYNVLTDAVGATEPVLRYAGSIGGPEDVTEVELLMPWLCDHLTLPCEFIQVADDDSATINLMQERGEINVQAGGLASRLRNLQDGFIDGSYRLGTVWELGESEVNLPDNTEMPPELGEIIPEGDQEAFEQIVPMISTGGLGVPIWAGPAISEDLLEVLREAMSELLSQEDLLAELGELQGAEAIAIDGAEGEKLLHESTATYVANTDVYKELQQRYWDEYWG